MQATAQDAAVLDARSATVVAALEDGMGGRARWDAAAVVRFDWVVERDGKEAIRVHHLWDRAHGRYRADWRTRDGAEIRTAFDLATRKGVAWVNGAPAAPAALDSLLEAGYGRFINDSYWFLMPWKLRDPGVRVEHAGEESLDGAEYDILHVSFDQVGLTPGDHYWIWVNRKSRRMDRWAYFLQDMEGEPSRDQARAWKWTDWRESAGVWFACDRRDPAPESTRRIHFPVMSVLPKVDGKVFEALDVAMPGVGASETSKR
jgi:hypothetical protein